MVFIEGEESLASAEFEHIRIRRELGQRRIKREPFEIFLNIFRFRKHGGKKISDNTFLLNYASNMPQEKLFFLLIFSPFFEMALFTL